MDERLLYIACYTDLYEAEAMKLRDSLDKLGLEHDICRYDSRGSWLANCHYIPIFCLAMMEEYPERKIVYLDADATVERDPILLRTLAAVDVEFAAHWLLGTELLNGTMLLGNTPNCRMLFRLWIQEDAKHPGRWEQKVLQDNFEHWAGHLSLDWYDLPPTYCRIFDHKKQMKKEYGIHNKKEGTRRTRVYENATPAIVHWQASRRLKQKVGA